MSSDNYAENDGSCWRSVKSDDGYDTADESGDAIREPSTWVDTSAETYSKGYNVWYFDPHIEEWALCGFFLGVRVPVEGSV
jgi:hypothetical protein